MEHEQEPPKLNPEIQTYDAWVCNRAVRFSRLVILEKMLKKIDREMPGDVFIVTRPEGKNKGKVRFILDRKFTFRLLSLAKYSTYQDLQEAGHQEVGDDILKQSR